MFEIEDEILNKQEDKIIVRTPKRINVYHDEESKKESSQDNNMASNYHQNSMQFNSK